MSERPKLQSLLEGTALGADARLRVLDYYEELARENKVQNLTRLISPPDFFEGHLMDVLELEKTSWVSAQAMDLGSGSGVPGLLAACVNPKSHWVLAESELRKREFLESTVAKLGLGQRVEV